MLTGDGGGGLERGGYILIKFYIHVPFLLELFVAFLDLQLQPVGEVVLEDCGADVAYPLPGNLVQLLLVWQVAVDVVWLASAKVLDLL